MHQHLIEGASLDQVITPLHSGIDVICSDRKFARIEGELNVMPAREMIFQARLAEADYDVNDPRYGASHYAKNVLCPVGMDTPSSEGVAASLQTIQLLNQLAVMNCRCIGILPIKWITVQTRRFSAWDGIMRRESQPG